MSFSITKHGDMVSILIEGHLVVGNRQALKQLVLDQLSAGERHFRIDFARTRYVDSSGLGVLLAVTRRVSEEAGTLRLANLSPDLRTLFELTKLDALFLYEGKNETGWPADLPPRPAAQPVGRRESAEHGEGAPPP